MLLVYSDLHAEMKPVTSDELETINAGLSLDFRILNSRILMSSDCITATSFDSGLLNTLEIKDISIDNGMGDGFSLDTPDDIPIRLELVPEAGVNFTQLFLFEIPDLSTYGDLPHLKLQNISINETDLGSLYVNKIAMQKFIFRTGFSNSGPANRLSFGDIGISSNIEEITYSASSLSESEDFSIKDIYFSGTSTGDPENPDTWEFSGPFMFGDISEQPVNIDIMQDVLSGNALQINIPANGNIRVKDIRSGNRSFGPCAIDGIKIHSMSIDIPGSLLMVLSG